MELIGTADVAVVFGAGLNQFTMRFGQLFSPGTRVVQVDIAPAATHPHVGGFIRGDARLVAEAVLDRLTATGATRERWAGADDIAAARAHEPGPAGGLAPDGRLDPRSVAVRIAELLESDPSTRDRVVVSDGGHTSSAGRTCTGRSRRPIA